MRKWVLIAMLAMAPAVAHADSSHSTGGDVTVNAQGGQGGDGGIGSGYANASNRNENSNSANAGVTFSGNSSVRTDVDNTAVSGSVSGARSDQKQGQLQGQEQGQDQGQSISAFNGNTTTVEAPDVKAMGRELAKHASSAAEVHSDSKAVDSACGDSTGLSAQAGVFGGGFATVSETCRAARLQHLEASNPSAVSTTLAEVTYFAGWFPRTVLHLATFGVLN